MKIDRPRAGSCVHQAHQVHHTHKIEMYFHLRVRSVSTGELTKLGYGSDCSAVTSAGASMRSTSSRCSDSEG